MKGIIRAIITIPFGLLKYAAIKLSHLSKFSGGFAPRIDLKTEISLDMGGTLRIRKKANLYIGNNVSLGEGTIITCHESISIGDGCEIAPYVLIYDHDHDVSADGGLGSNKFKTTPIVIGKNVWIGANAIILRGSEIGDNCVVAAGSLVKGKIPSNSIYIQKRQAEIKYLK